jgi:molybdenum cofactor biosynthesis enzyme MoaA
MSEYNKRTIARQMRPRTIEGTSFEVSLAEHCNNCCQCCDHFSQLSPKKLLDIETFERDLAKVAQLLNHKMGCISLLGGEPLLNQNVIDYFRITRNLFPQSGIILLTNGLRLIELEKSPNGNIWEACNKYNIEITVTVYKINFDYASLEKKAEEYNVLLGMSSIIHAAKATMSTKISDKHNINLSGNVPNNYFISCCYYNKCMVLKEGKFYPCPRAANIHIFNEYFDQAIPLTPDDSFDIYAASDWQGVSDFGASFHPLCKYCDVAKWKPYGEWALSKQVISEYV